MGTAWSGSTRRARLPANWAAIRAERLKTDGGQCTAILPSGIRCPAAAADVDHVEAMTDDHSLAALRSLCGPHHRAKSGREGARASGAVRRRIAAARYRKPEPHPGLRREAS